MEASHLKKLYRAMAENGYELLELELEPKKRLRLKLDATSNVKLLAEPFEEEIEDEIETDVSSTQIEIRSDKVGTFTFSGETFKHGDMIKKDQTLGFVKGISFQDRIKCSVDGTIASMEINEGDVVDYGRLLFVINMHDGHQAGS